MGHSIQVSGVVRAEDPNKDFQPSTGLLTAVAFAPELPGRQTWVEHGSEVTALLRPDAGQLIGHPGPDRTSALAKLSTGLADSRVHGIETNLSYLKAILTGKRSLHRRNDHHAVPLDIHLAARHTFDVLDGEDSKPSWWMKSPAALAIGTSGCRLRGRWMTVESFRLATAPRQSPRRRIRPRNHGGRADPALQWSGTSICLTGADLQATLEKKWATLVKRYSVIPVTPGQILKTKSHRLGARANAPRCSSREASMSRLISEAKPPLPWASSVATADGACSLGDVIHLTKADPSAAPLSPLPGTGPPRPHPTTWTCRVLYGPHGAPDFFTAGDMEPSSPPPGKCTTTPPAPA